MPAEHLRGTIQTDILKEYIAQKEYIFPPEPSMRLVTDMVEYCSRELPKWHPISISGYHIREAGSTAAQELAFTLSGRLHLRRVGGRARARRRRLRAAALLLLQRASRLLRGDREVPGRAPDLGARAARPLRRPQPALVADALPHADGRRLADGAAAGGEHRPDRDRGAGGGARRDAEPAHELVRRGAGAADRGRGPDRAADAAGDRARDRGREHDRPARRLLLRRGADEQDRGAGVRVLRPDREAGRDGRGDQTELPAKRDSRFGISLSGGGRARRARRRRRQPLRARRTRRRSRSSRSTPRSRRSRSNG